jgi:RNA polymerase sigma-70 factor (ECF subfamily)
MSTDRNSPPDDELAARMAGLNEADAQAACHLLYQRYARRLLGFLRPRVPTSELDDLHHSVWVRVWQARADMRAGNVRAWLFRIAGNLAIDHHRRHRPDLHPTLPERPDDQLAPEEVLMERERMERLKHCIQRLPAEARAIVEARLEGRSYPEICEEQRISPNQAYGLYHSAQQQLHKCVNRERP